ncbi:MAG TPA: MBL fold metallo-hydrolase [Sphingomicrobium sp.]|nr:MBL fold metallo-hydrolase [Sphingomicrobium sp.]
MQFEFLPAFQGDCFLIHAGTKAKPVLILVDGGPGGTYNKHLKPRLMQLRDERELDEFTPLVINLVIVSHVDDDHINGIVELFRDIRKAKMNGDPPLFTVLGLWHNSFDEIIGNDEVNVATAQFGTASIAPVMADSESHEQFDAALILQSIAQGNELRDLANSDELQIPINDGFGGLIKSSPGKKAVRKIGGVSFTVIAPRAPELVKLQKDHDKWLKEQKKAGKVITPGSMLQAMLDTAVPNLSSIVLLADDGKRTALLTGDARADFIVTGAEEIGLIAKGATLDVDLFKLPHHGSDRNVDPSSLQRIRAKQHLFTGNGLFGNPERATFEMLRDARPGAEMELYLTYDIASIDPTRKVVHAQERQKAINRGKPPGPVWSDSANALATLVPNLPNSMKVIQPTGPAVKL